MTNTGTGDGTIVVKQAPTAATRQRATTVGVGGAVSTAGLTAVIAYGFKLFANSHPGFETPIEAFGPEMGAVIYGAIAGTLTAAWQAMAAFMMRGTRILERRFNIRDEDEAGA